ncbi:MAG: extracellular solute-binding protein [Anaerolineae bacterium]|nr:extracellular solute-binding protein [Anaerolineae bacterium]
MIVAAVPVMAQGDEVELRITWYDDGAESEVLRAQLDAFEEMHPNISVVIDQVAYGDLHTLLQAQVETGEAPDLARITFPGRFLGYYLDLTDYVEDAQYWLDNVPGAVLGSMQADDMDTGIYGYPTQFTVTGPFINVTLFEQAGVEIPADDATWEEWVAAATEVAETLSDSEFTVYPVAIDRTGHRFWGPSLSRCATYINEDGTFTVDSEGFRSTAQMIMDWHNNGQMPADVWGGSGGNYVPAAPYFINGQLVLYMSGSWQIGNFAENIGDAFDYKVIPNPSGECGATGVPGGALTVAFADTDHPEEVGMLMDYLFSEDVVADFYADTLFLPGHLGLIEAGIEYPSSAEELNAFAAMIPNLMDEAYALQYHPQGPDLNGAIRDRLSQVIVGELTLDEAVERIQSDVDAVFATLE